MAKLSPGGVVVVREELFAKVEQLVVNLNESGGESPRPWKDEAAAPLGERSSVSNYQTGLYRPTHGDRKPFVVASRVSMLPEEVGRCVVHRDHVQSTQHERFEADPQQLRRLSSHAATVASDGSGQVSR